jgi:predicted signal transduction protein with EAL and GGDEF domain
MLTITGNAGIPQSADATGVDELARRDQLTAFGNRLAFDDALSREISRTRRGGAALSLLVLDVDDFKSVNESHGRDRGDELLKAVAGIIAAQVREPDLRRSFASGGSSFGNRSSTRVGDRVLVEAYLSGRGEISGVDVPQWHYWNVCWFADGELTRRQLFKDRAEAFRAAGLRE